MTQQPRFDISNDYEPVVPEEIAKTAVACMDAAASGSREHELARMLRVAADVVAAYEARTGVLPIDRCSDGTITFLPADEVRKWRAKK